MDWIIRTGVWSIALLLVYGLTPPLRKGCGKRAVVTEAVNNARIMGMGLSAFDKEYASRPNGDTIKEVARRTGSSLPFSDATSNDLFCQLLATGLVQSELNFYAKAKNMRKPDNIWTSGSVALAHGECAFAYISGVPTSADPETPIAFGPVIPGTTTLDRMSCEGRAIVLKSDNAVMVYPINPAGKIIDHGLDLLDPRQPYWHGKAPDVKWPK